MDGLRILAIDDQREILDVVRLALETTTDWSLTTHRCTADALSVYDGATYDVVLLDLNIPGEDAASSVAALRERNVTRTLALLTGSPVSDAERQRVGADIVLNKPFDPMTFAEMIEACLIA